MSCTFDARPLEPGNRPCPPGRIAAMMRTGHTERYRMIVSSIVVGRWFYYVFCALLETISTIHAKLKTRCPWQQGDNSTYIIQLESHLVEYCCSSAMPLHTRKIWAICSATTHQRCLFVGCESSIIKHQNEHIVKKLDIMLNLLN